MTRWQERLRMERYHARMDMVADEPQPEDRVRDLSREERCEACGQRHGNGGPFCRHCEDQMENWYRDYEPLGGFSWPGEPRGDDL